MDVLLTQEPADQKPKQRRGFAILDAARRAEIAQKGGRKAHALGRAHKFTREEARAAGQKGAQARKVRLASA